MIPETTSQIEVSGEEPKSPVTAILNYDAKSCDINNATINGDIESNQTIFYEADDSA